MIVAESVHPILQRTKNPSLDPVALSVFLRTGLFLGDDTPFLGVRQLGPNSVLTWSPLDGLHVRQGPRPAGALQSGIGRTQAVKKYAELFQEAVTQAVFAGEMGRLVVPLSGGRDSRHIAYALHKAGITPVTYATAMHQPWRADEDARVAKLVCEALGVPHVVIPQPRFRLKNCVVAPRETGFLTDELAWLLPFRDWITGNADTTFDGVGGDMMSAALGQTWQFHESFQARNFKTIIQQLFTQSRIAGWEGILAGELMEKLSPEIAHRRVREELELHAGHHNPARSFYFWNRTRKQLALSPFCLFRAVRVAAPYLMPELWSFLDGLPFEIVADRTFHDETIAYAYPAFAHIPYEDIEATRPFRRSEALGVGVDFLRLLCSFRAIKGFDLTRQLKRAVGSLVDHRVWWSQSGALYLLALLDVPNLEIRIDRP
jgi:hypothetical protein